MADDRLPRGKISLTSGFFEKIEVFTKTLGVLVLGYSGIGWIKIFRWYEQYSGCKSALDGSEFDAVCDIGVEEMGLNGLEAIIMTIIGLYLLSFSVKGYWYRQELSKYERKN